MNYLIVKQDKILFVFCGVCHFMSAIGSFNLKCLFATVDISHITNPNSPGLK